MARKYPTSLSDDELPSKADLVFGIKMFRQIRKLFLKMKIWSMMQMEFSQEPPVNFLRSVYFFTIA